jgi:23S rRNA pseudouridine1911/1915/1917 synthase
VLNTALRTKLKKFPRPALHAGKLLITHPATEKQLELEAPLPEDMLKLIDDIRRLS